MDDLQDKLNTSNKTIHIIILSESWIYENEQQFFNINYYTAMHDCRSGRGGGTSIY